MSKFTKRAIALITAGMLAMAAAPAQAADDVCHGECTFGDDEALVVTGP